MSKKIILVVVTVLVIVLSFSIITRIQTKNLEKKIGIKAVNLLYSFNDIYELDKNMSELNKICTEKVYNELTIDNENRTLNTYLKFKEDSVKVKVIKSRSNYVLYRLKTDAISKDRLFVFIYDVNNKGKISYVREVEAIDFVQNID